MIELKEPFFISSRLLPAVKVGDATISIEYAGNEPDGRVRYRYFIDFADGTEHVGEDLRSGVRGGSLREGMESLLSFLEACSESRRHGLDEPGENADLFPDNVGEWACQNDGEIASVRLWIEETEGCCVEAR
jgi:hypothetical protein